ncbi:MAG: hypothetical protein QXQ39_06825 [Conexivisphaerales archaeon]
MIWWLKESRWEAKNIPLFGFIFSVRQFVIIFVFMLLGLLSSLAFSFITYKLGVFFFLSLIGLLLASIKVRMIPWELQLLYALTRPKGGSIKMEAKPKAKVQAQVLKEEPPQEMFSDSEVPLSFTGRVDVEEPAKVILLVDGIEASSANVSHNNPNYRLLFYPASYSIGVHELTVKLGTKEVERVKITIRPRLGGKKVELLEGAA